MRLRAQSTIVDAAGQGFQPNTACALAALKTCFRPKSGVVNCIWRSNSATIWSTTSGIPRVGTFFALAPSSDRKTLPYRPSTHSRLRRRGEELARKLAAGREWIGASDTLAARLAARAPDTYA